MTISLPAGPRAIRRLRRPEAPWDGVLAQDPDGARCMLVEVDLLDDSIAGRDGAGGHLAVVTDLVRTAEGHLARLPLCTERVASFTARRVASAAPLNPGETVTLAVSLLRALADMPSEVAAEVGGQWWLTEDGRPVLVGGGQQSARDGAATLITELQPGSDPALAPVLARAAELIAEPRRLAREATEVEAELFAIADAEPLATAVLAPVHAVPVLPAAAGEDGPPDSPRWWAGMLSLVDAPMAELTSRLATALWRRLRTDRPRRQRRAHPLVAAALVCAVVLGVGVLWPRGEDEAATAQARPPSPTPSATVRATPSPSAPTSTQAAAAQLLELRANCSDESCRAATQEDPAATFTGDVGVGKRTVTLLDDFGGAAVLRVDAKGEPQRLVVIVRQNGKWLLRDIRDVAEQPEG